MNSAGCSVSIDAVIVALLHINRYRCAIRAAPHPSRSIVLTPVPTATNTRPARYDPLNRLGDTLSWWLRQPAFARGMIAFGASCLFWGALGVFSFVGAALDPTYPRDRLAGLAGYEAAESFGWSLFTPFIFWGAHAVIQRRWHLSAILAFVLVAAGMSVLSRLSLVAWASHWTGFRPLVIDVYTVLRVLPPAFLHVLSFTALVAALQLRRREDEHELEAAVLAAELSESRLLALHLQLNPHFLFNALNGISALISRQPEAANRALSQLSTLLRAVLAQKPTHLVLLSDDLQVLESYLSIERMRFAGWLTIHMEIAPNVARRQVPPFLVQPLVENAIKHGIAPRSGPGCVAIRATAVEQDGEQYTLITIEDDGVGLDRRGDRHQQPGVGLRNVNERLALLYGERARLELRQGEFGGAVAMVWIPATVSRRA
ncbi:MAG: histidine kinase [Gemmatimonadota bacterium]